MTLENEPEQLVWATTTEAGRTLWYTNLDDWSSVPPWPWVAAEIRPAMTSYEATLTDGDYMHQTWLGYYRSVAAAQRAIESILDAMRRSATVIYFDDHGAPVTVSIKLCVDYSVGEIVNAPGQRVGEEEHEREDGDENPQTE